jgi:hypothetical protein
MLAMGLFGIGGESAVTGDAFAAGFPNDISLEKRYRPAPEQILAQ